MALVFCLSELRNNITIEYKNLIYGRNYKLKDSMFFTLRCHADNSKYIFYVRPVNNEREEDLLHACRRSVFNFCIESNLELKDWCFCERGKSLPYNKSPPGLANFCHFQVLDKTYNGNPCSKMNEKGHIKLITNKRYHWLFNIADEANKKLQLIYLNMPSKNIHTLPDDLFYKRMCIENPHCGIDVSNNNEQITLKGVFKNYKVLEVLQTI